MNSSIVFRVLLAAAVAISLFGSAAPIPALAENHIQNTITVNSAGDASDIDTATEPCVCSTTSPGAVCTLRAAIETANACSSGAPHTIIFNADYNIRPATNLPALSRNNTTISGVGRTIKIYPAVSNSTTRGLAITGDSCAVHHLWIQDFGTGIVVYGSSNIIGLKDDGTNDNLEGNTIVLNNTGIDVDTGSFNQVSGNYIGVDNAGSLTYGNYGSGVDVSTSFTTIGTDGDGNSDGWEGNVISNNAEYGIYVTSAGSYATISGNTIGISAKAGNIAAPNDLGGIALSASYAQIGTDGNNTSDSLERNIISGNGYTGIGVNNGQGHKIAGNYIGLASNGNTVVANNSSGIYIAAAVHGTTIGVDESNTSYSANERNVISGNTSSGIEINGYQNTVAGNYIGLSADGTANKGNSQSGILAYGHDNTIGVDSDALAAAYEGNVISANGGTGVTIGLEGDANIIAGNLIGLNAAGSAALGNTYDGVKILSAVVNTRIGTDGDGVADSYERNVISANSYNGVDVAVSAEAAITGNYIGTDKLGGSDLGNERNGVYIEAGNNEIIRIGGNSISMRNVISGNTLSGIYLDDADNHIIAGNYIGVDMEGAYAIPNGTGGIRIVNSQATRIGTDGDGTGDSNEGNLISGNTTHGIQVTGANTLDTVIAGNFIGLNWNGSAAIPNSSFGISLWGNPVNTIIGVNGDGSSGDYVEGNRISGNSLGGISVSDQSGTVISGNTLGLSVDCSPCTKIPNGKGIWIMNSAKGDEKAIGAVRIGSNADGVSDDKEVNYISGNSQPGIQIDSGSGHIIAGNIIGLDRNGAVQANASDGINLGIGAGSGIRVGTNGDGVNDSAERNVISGNTSSGLRISAGPNVIAGNYIGTGLDGLTDRGNGTMGVYLDTGNGNIIGANGDGSAGEANEGNTISGNTQNGVWIASGAGNRVSGNRIGVNAPGTAALPNSSQGISIQTGASGSIIGSNGDGISDALEGNVISGNTGNGIHLYSSSALIADTRITGNTIGLGSNRESLIPNGASGISISGTTNTVIGLDSETQRNLLSANDEDGIYISGIDEDLQITGNRIGLTASGAAAGNGGRGIRITSPDKAESKTSPTTIIQSNRIHNNTSAGVYLETAAGNGHKIVGNSFDSNGGLGIDLEPSGVTANDAMDGDSGPNGLQNHPVVELVEQPSPSSLRVTGSFNSTPSTTFTIQLYAATSADPSGFGEGLDVIHTFSLSTDGSGGATFDQTFTYLLGTSHSEFSAIAMAPDGSTSEFGPSLHVVLALEPLRVYLPVVMR